MTTSPIRRPSTSPQDVATLYDLSPVDSGRRQFVNRRCMLSLISTRSCQTELPNSVHLFHISGLFAHDRWAKYCDQRVCMSVCLSARISQKSIVQSSQSFLLLSPVVVARLSSGGNAIRYVLPVVWMTSCFHMMERMGQNSRRRVSFVEFARCRHRGEVAV